MHDLLEGAAATAWARDVGLFVGLHRVALHSRAWSTYLDGLTATYSRWGVSEIIDRERLEREGCQLFWLLHDRSGACIGGIRVEGPFADPSRYGGVSEMVESSGHARLVAEIDRATLEGLIEFKGAWSDDAVCGAGSVLARCMQHSLWWLGVPRAFCISASHAESSWYSSGATRLDGVAASPFPNPNYESVPLFWNDGHETRVSVEQALHIEAERRYLTPARERIEAGNGATAPSAAWAQWHPELLFESDPRLQELAESGVELVDRLSLFEADLDDLLPPIGPDLAAEPAHWVHLPWRNTALRMRGPDAHWRLRTDRDRYKLLDDELESMRARSVGVVGLSVGSSAAFTLAQEGLCGQLRLADHDVLDPTNLNRLSGSILDIGVPKTHIVARRLAELDPYLPVHLFDQGVTEDNVESFVSGLDVVVEECDSIDMKVLVRRQARSCRVPVIMETSDRGLLDVERYDLDPDREPFHGLVGELDVAELAGLSTDDKVPYVLAILEADQLSASMAASMVEIDQTTRTWPQLASDVALGSCLVAATVRRLFTRSDELRSGRARLDIDDTLDALADPPLDSINVEPAPTAHPPLPTSFVEAVLTAASLAPSGGNMQPWRFDMNESCFDVFIAPDPPVGMDIGQRGSAVACGAALANVLVVAAAHGRIASSPGPIAGTAIEVVVDLDHPDLAGRVRFGSETDSEWAGLEPLITKRLSNRHYGPSMPLSVDELERLEAATAIGGGRLCYVPTAELEDLIDLWVEADRARMLSPRLHREMMSELRRPAVDSLTEGIDERSFEFSATDIAKLPILRRADVMAHLERLDAGVRLGDDTRKRFRASSGLVIVVVSGSSQADFVRGGVALQRMWLEATRLGLGLHPMSPVFGYAQSEEELAEVIRSDRAELLYAKSREALSAVGIQAGESFVLASRILSGPPPTAISQRRKPRAISLRDEEDLARLNS